MCPAPRRMLPVPYSEIELSLLAPPYQPPGETIPFPAIGGSELPEKGLVLVDGLEDVIVRREVTPVLSLVREFYPWSAIAAVAPSAAVGLAMMSRPGSWLDIAVLARGDSVSSLLEQLTDPEMLGIRVGRTVRLVRPHLPAQMVEIIERLIDAGGDAAEDASSRTVRRWFHMAGLPPPGRWKTLGRLLPLVMRIQRYGEGSLERIALEGDCYSAAAMSDQFLRAFGIRPSAVMGTLGWRWLLRRWFQRWGQAASPPS